MFTKTFTLDRHIEELRAELHGSADIDEACCIKAELEAMLMITTQASHPRQCREPKGATITSGVKAQG